MTSKRAIERRIDDLDPSGGGDGPDEITFTDYVVGTDWEPDDDSNSEYGDLAPGESKPISRLRCWRDERGEWHSERTDLRDDDGTEAGDR